MNYGLTSPPWAAPRAPQRATLMYPPLESAPAPAVVLPGPEGRPSQMILDFDSDAPLSGGHCGVEGPCESCQ